MNKYFSLDEINIKDYGAIIGAIDRDSKTENDSQGEVESISTLSIDAPIRRNHCTKYTETLNFELNIIWKDGIDKQSYAEFSNVFFNSKEYKKLIFTDDKDLKNYYYMAKLLNPNTVTIHGKIYEVDVEVECQTPYARKIDDFEMTCVAKGNYTIINESHYDNEVYPIIKICGGGQIIVENTTTNSKVIANLSSSETLTISEELDVTSTDTTIQFPLTKIDLDNCQFMYLQQGRNDIAISGSGTLVSIDITFPIYKKLGV